MHFTKITSLVILATLATAVPFQPEKRATADQCFGGTAGLQGAADSFNQLSSGWFGNAHEAAANLLNGLAETINRANQLCTDMATLESQASASFESTESDLAGQLGK